ncbi:MAG: hypothetical protein FIB02_07790 [Desulfuromonas sp.]|nr:hypothetical protein [Desulfuromonas sp.]
MRCPKCGFHSFDYLDNCKKCGVDLSELKLRSKFQGYVIPPTAENVPEPEAPFQDLPEVAEAEEEAIDFGFDILEEESPPPQPAFTSDPGERNDDFAEPGSDDPSAINLAMDSGLNFDQPFPDDDDFSFDQPAPAGSGLNLDQPFPEESESLPDDGLPKFDDRF